MNKFDSALREMCSLEKEATLNKFPCKRNPVIKLIVTVIYVICLTAVRNQCVDRLFSFGLYPFVFYLAYNIPFLKSFKRIRVALGGVFLLSVTNVWFASSWSDGVLSMIGLCLKGIFAVMAVYLLTVTTSMEELCIALRKLGCPESFVVVVLLIYRYINVLIKETKRLWEAYEVNSAGQRGIAFRHWGAFLGQLLLRSMNRAQNVYDSMCVRGFQWRMTREHTGAKFDVWDFLWLVCWCTLFGVCLWTDLFRAIGQLFQGLG